MFNQKKIWHTFLPKDSLVWGIGFLLFTFTFSLLAYYSHIDMFRETSLSTLLLSYLLLFYTFYKDVNQTIQSKWISILIILSLIILYFSLRIILHRFDFSVGDPSDYYLAGVCSVTYKQDIGFFLPLTASVSAVGYTIFGLKYAPFINILIQLPVVPLAYIVMKRLSVGTLVSLLITILIIILPLDIWFASTSFSDPLWQLLLLCFILLTTEILTSSKTSYKVLLVLFLQLAIVPFLRGEAVLYFGLILGVVTYHIWLHGSFKSASTLMLGLIVLSVSIHATLGIRSHYLLQMQFSRVIPGITETLLMSILYGVSLFGFLWLGALILVKRYFQKLSLPLILTVLLLIFKIVFVYYYTQQKVLSFTDLIFLNEYDFALGNFGLPLSLFIGVGIVFLYWRALKGDIPAFILVLVYTILYIPFVMQKVTFQDPHAFLYYWNRYYLSMLMMVHLFALGLILQKIYDFIKNRISLFSSYPAPMFALLFILFSSLSLPLDMYKIVLTEPHQKNAYTLVPWMKKHVKNQSVSVVYDSTIIYKQNKGHIGVNNIKYLISRLFSVFKINGKDYQGVSPTQLDSNLTLHADLSQRRYVLCVSRKPCHLQNSYLHYFDSLTLPLRWREHYSLHTPKAQKDKELSHSYQNQWKLHFELYRVNPRLRQKFAFNKTISLSGHSSITKKIFPKGWYTTPHDTGVWSLGLHPKLFFPFIEKESYANYSVALHYYLFNASPKFPRTITFSSHGKILKKITTTISQTKSITLPIDRVLLKHAPLQIDIDIDTYDYKKSKVPYGVFIESVKIIKH